MCHVLEVIAALMDFSLFYMILSDKAARTVQSRFQVSCAGRKRERERERGDLCHPLVLWISGTLVTLTPRQSGQWPTVTWPSQMFPAYAYTPRMSSLTLYGRSSFFIQLWQKIPPAYHDLKWLSRLFLQANILWKSCGCLDVLQLVKCVLCYFMDEIQLILYIGSFKLCVIF